MKHIITALIALFAVTLTAHAAPIVSVSASAPVADFAPITAASLPDSTPVGQPIVVSFTGSAPVNIHWFTWIGGGAVEIGEAQNRISFTPRVAGWYYAVLWNEQPSGLDVNNAHWGLRVINGSVVGWFRFTSSQSTGWTLAQ